MVEQPCARRFEPHGEENCLGASRIFITVSEIHLMNLASCLRVCWRSLMDSYNAWFEPPGTWLLHHVFLPGVSGYMVHELGRNWFLEHRVLCIVVLVSLYDTHVFLMWCAHISASPA